MCIYIMFKNYSVQTVILEQLDILCLNIGA